MVQVATLSRCECGFNSRRGYQDNAGKVLRVARRASNAKEGDRLYPIRTKFIRRTWIRAYTPRDGALRSSLQSV